MFLLRATEEDAAELIYLAGYLAGAGLAEAETLKRVLNTAMEFDDFATVPPGVEVSEWLEDEDYEGELEDGHVLAPPPGQPDLSEFAGMVPGGEVPHVDPATDPTSPENLGVALEHYVEEAPPAPPSTPQDDFGAGPPGRS